jgi:hypothetical protein
MVEIDWLEAAAQIDEYTLKNCSYHALLYLFYLVSLCRQESPGGLTALHARYSSNEVLCSKEVLFWSRVDRQLHFGIKTPTKPKQWNPQTKFPAKSMHSNNF